MNSVLSSFRSVLLSYSEVFFLKSIVCGFFVLVISFLNPNIGVSGLISILASYAFAHFMGYEKEYLKSGYNTYNALLVGLSVGQLFTITPLSILYISIASIITFLVTISISDIFSRFLGLPILSLPFVIVTSLIYLSASKFTNLYVSELYAAGNITILEEYFPLWINGLLRSFGAIVFMPSSIIGLCLLSLILAQSRVLFLLAVLGYYFGTSLQGIFIGSIHNTYYDLNAFNYPLIAMAIGGVFNIPSVKSFIFALTGVGMSTVLIKSIDIFWGEYGIPVFTLPFLVVTLGYTYVLGLLNYKLRPLVFKNTPEETAEYFYTQQQRYAQSKTFYLPFTDEWSVYQGFDSKWTHQGIWKYAYDFIKKDKRGLSYANEGKVLEDYYCYKSTVSSPCQGTVVSAVDFYVDNPIGVVDTINNWGNYIIIKDSYGLYVGICHLAQGSLLVKAGDWVEAFQPLALCGNSGYSPQPHIHMQYQSTSYLSSITIPFTYVAVEMQKEVFHHLTPRENVKVKPYLFNDFYFQVTNFVLDEVLRFRVLRDGNFLEEIEFKVRMGIDSTFYLERENARLYFGKYYSSFFFYHLEGRDKYLELLFQALPSFPLSYTENKSWKDKIPNKFIKNTKKFSLPQFNLKSFLEFSFDKNGTYEFESDIIIAGEVKDRLTGKSVKTQVYLDPYVKFKEIRVGNIKLKSVGQIEN